jgi:hypothetical protein
MRLAAATVLTVVLGSAPAAGAQDGESSPIGDLAGNWPWTVWLLIPLVLVLALVTALALGAASEPEPTGRRRSVSRALDRGDVAHRAQ